MKTRNHLITSGILVVCILVFGFTHKLNSNDKDIITWGERSLVWEDFELVGSLEKDYVATIYSNISCPNLITENTSRIYAFMNPNLSERLKDKFDSDNVLVHEQYHFNITEYCARLLRKEIVKKGLGGLSLKTMKELQTKYSKKLDSLQNVYDSITDHNGNWKQQRFWELQIDDWLRQTAYYKNEDIHDYYNFTKSYTQFYRGIYVTLTHKILTSYPVGEKDIKYGNTYEVQFVSHKEKIVKFYNNGVLTNGGYFETANAKIIENEKGVFEIHYLNADETYNENLEISLKKSFINKQNDRVVHYFNKEGKRITKSSIYETKLKYNSKEKSYYESYFNKNGKIIANKNGVYHIKRVLDKKDRTILLESYDRNKRLKNDNEYIARRKYQYNKDNKKINFKLYDESGDFAFHLDDYHLSYEYDERSNIVRVTSLDEYGNKAYDNNGASIYEYVYDLYDRNIGVKRFNKDHIPIVANDDYFQNVKEYDSLGRIQLNAFYYPGYVLKYTDKLWGATKYVYEADSIVKEYNVNVTGNLIQDDFNVAIIKKQLNKKKEILSETYFNSDGNFSTIKDGIVMYKYTYNNQGKLIESAAYDSIGGLREFEADVAIVRWDYDAYGNKSKTTYFNADNQLAMATDSVTYNIYKFNKEGNLTERTNYNRKMKPALINGVFKTRFLLTKSGLDSIQLEYGQGGKLKNGVAITKLYYNKYDNITRTEYYNANNRRISNSDGISAENIIYNKRQYEIGNEYFDERNRRVNNDAGVSIKKWERDELGHILTFSYLDKHSNPVIGPNGYHILKYEWAVMGEISRTASYDVNLSLIEDEYGTAVYEYKLEPSGMYTEVKRFNKDGELSENSFGTAVTKYNAYLDGLYYLENELNAKGEVVNDSLTK